MELKPSNFWNPTDQNDWFKQTDPVVHKYVEQLTSPELFLKDISLIFEEMKDNTQFDGSEDQKTFLGVLWAVNQGLLEHDPHRFHDFIQKSNKLLGNYPSFTSKTWPNPTFEAKPLRSGIAVSLFSNHLSKKTAIFGSILDTNSFMLPFYQNNVGISARGVQVVELGADSHFIWRSLFLLALAGEKTSKKIIFPLNKDTLSSGHQSGSLYAMLHHVNTHGVIPNEQEQKKQNYYFHFAKSYWRSRDTYLNQTSFFHSLYSWAVLTNAAKNPLKKSAWLEEWPKLKLHNLPPDTEQIISQTALSVIANTLNNPASLQSHQSTTNFDNFLAKQRKNIYDRFLLGKDAKTWINGADIHNQSIQKAVDQFELIEEFLLKKIHSQYQPAADNFLKEKQSFQAMCLFLLGHQNASKNQPTHENTRHTWTLTLETIELSQKILVEQYKWFQERYSPENLNGDGISLQLNENVQQLDIVWGNTVNLMHKALKSFKSQANSSKLLSTKQHSNQELSIALVDNIGNNPIAVIFWAAAWIQLHKQFDESSKFLELVEEQNPNPTGTNATLFSWMKHSLLKKQHKQVLEDHPNQSKPAPKPSRLRI